MPGARASRPLFRPFQHFSHRRSEPAEGYSMSDKLTDRWVNCPHCQLGFTLQVSAAEDWRIEHQCPSCACWACFTAADTPERTRPDPAELDAQTHLLGAQLWLPINAHPDHPAVA